MDNTLHTQESNGSNDDQINLSKSLKIEEALEKNSSPTQSQTKKKRKNNKKKNSHKSVDPSSENNTDAQSSSIMN